jgi:hypothetical protein
MRKGPGSAYGKASLTSVYKEFITTRGSVFILEPTMKRMEHIRFDPDVNLLIVMEYLCQGGGFRSEFFFRTTLESGA